MRRGSIINAKPLIKLPRLNRVGVEGAHIIPTRWQTLCQFSFLILVRMPSSCLQVIQPGIISFAVQNNYSTFFYIDIKEFDIPTCLYERGHVRRLAITIKWNATSKITNQRISRLLRPIPHIPTNSNAEYIQTQNVNVTDPFINLKQI